jgi:hypothetical protein
MKRDSRFERAGSIPVRVAVVAFEDGEVSRI